MFGFRRFIDSINIIPKSSSTITEQGDLEVLSTNGKLLYHNGTTASPVLTESHTATVTNKTIDADSNTITNIENADIKANAAIDATKIADGSVSNTEFQYLDGLTGNIQDQIDAANPAIPESTFNITNNQVSPDDITGFNFNNASVRSFIAQVSVSVDATSDLYESYQINGIQKGSSWEIGQSAVGDSSLVIFSITNSGQMQYISANYPGFSSGTIKFKAQITGV